MRCGSCVCHALVALLGVLVSPLTASAADIPAPPEPAELVALRDLIEIDAGKPSILCIGVTGRTGPRVLYHLVVVVDGETFAERLRPSNDAPGKVCRVVQPGAHDVAVVAASAVGPPSLLGALGWWVGSSARRLRRQGDPRRVTSRAARPRVRWRIIAS